MNEIFGPILYGIVQGITEFLPVSSSGHLALIPFFTGKQDPGVIFDLAMHVGTALAVMLAFGRQLRELSIGTLGLLKGKRSNFAINFWMATLVTIILAFAIKDVAETYARNPIWIAFNLIVFGFLMFVADRYCKNNDYSLRKNCNIKLSIIMGIAQGLAVFPGVSRSGATLTAGRFMGMTRHEAGSFSFMLSLPIILGGFVYKCLEIYRGNIVANFDWSSMLIGIVIAFVVGYATIKFFMQMLQRFSLSIYFWYRIVLATVVLLTIYRN